MNTNRSATFKTVPTDPRNQQPRGGDNGWTKPREISSELKPVTAFHRDMLPKAFASFVMDIAERIQCPPDFPAVAIMVCYSSVIGRRVGIRPHQYDDWFVTPNLWGCVIGRPGILKTPAIVEPLRFVQRLEIEAKQKFERALKEYNVALRIGKARVKVINKNLRKAIDAGDKGKGDVDKLRKDLSEAEPEAPVRARFMTNDSTVEKIGELLHDNPNGILLFRDELVGALRALEKEGQETARAFWLEAWNGSNRFTFDRIMRGTVDIEAACMSVLGGITPGPFEQYLAAAMRGGTGDDGLVQRLQLAVWPDTNAEWKKVDRYPDNSAKNLVWEIFRQGAQLEFPAEEGELAFVRFDHAAQDRWWKWQSELEARLRSNTEHPAIESHLAKFRSLVPSLALLCHLAEGGSGPVDDGSLIRAICWAGYLETHARRIYEAANNPIIEGARTIVRHIKERDLQDGFSARDV
jgi:putative DNA primase/helicase